MPPPVRPAQTDPEDSWREEAHLGASTVGQAVGPWGAQWWGGALPAAPWKVPLRRWQPVSAPEPGRGWQGVPSRAKLRSGEGDLEGDGSGGPRHSRAGMSRPRTAVSDAPRGQPHSFILECLLRADLVQTLGELWLTWFLPHGAQGLAGVRRCHTYVLNCAGGLKEKRWIL